MSGAERVQVQLLGLPIDVHRRANEHAESLRRELTLMRHSITPDAAPARIKALSNEIGHRYQGQNIVTDQMLADALESGVNTVDLTYVVPADCAPDFVRLLQLLEELDRFCADRDLLTLVPSPEGQAYRAWWIGEFVAQVGEGRAPQRWEERGLSSTTTVDPDADADAGSLRTITVEGDLDLEQAPTLREALLDRIERGATELVVDLGGCHFMDSTGLSLILTTHLRLEAEGGSLVLRNLNPQVASILELSGVDGILT